MIRPSHDCEATSGQNAQVESFDEWLQYTVVAGIYNRALYVVRRSAWKSYIFSDALTAMTSLPMLIGLQSYALPLYFKRTGPKSYSCIVTQCVEDFCHFKQETPLSLYWFLKNKPRRWTLCNGVAYSLPPELTMGQWVTRVNKFGWVTWVTGQYPWPVDPFYIVLIRYPTWFSGSWIMKKALRGDANTARWL